MNNNRSLKEKTISGMSWSFVDNMVQQIVQLIFQIILARLLVPADFGLIGMITVFTSFSLVLVESGLIKALIREKESSQDDYSTVFIFNFLVSVTLYLIIFMSANMISKFFNEPQLVNIVRVLSLIIVINALSLVQQAMLIKKIDFKIQTKITFISSFISGLIAIFLAFKGYGVWSLVIKMVLMQLIRLVLLLSIIRWKPSLRFNVTSFKRLYSFGWRILLGSVLTNIYQNIYYLIIGKGFSTVVLGLYTKSNSLAIMAGSSISMPIDKVSYPVLSRIQDDDVRLKRAYKTFAKHLAYINFPVMLGLAAVAPSLIPLILGAQWIPAIPYFQILCIANMINPLHLININILKVKGRSDLYLKVNIVKKVVAICLISIVVVLRLNIFILLFTVIIISYSNFLISAMFSKQLISYSYIDQVKDISVYYISSFVMSILIYMINYFGNINLVILLITQVSLGVIFWIIISYIFKFDEYFNILDLIKKSNLNKLVIKKNT